MFGGIKRAALAAVVILNLLGSIAIATPALAADTTSLTFSPSTVKVTAGNSFNAVVKINTLANTKGAQFAVTYDSTKLTLNSVTWGTFFTAYQKNKANGCASSFTEPFTPVSSPGTSLVGAYALVGCTGVGPTGSGTLATINFTASSSDATSNTTIGLTSVTINNVSSADLTVGSGTASITALLPDFTVSNQSTAEANGNISQFTVSWQVNNIGTASGAASLTKIAATCATPASSTFNTPSIANGANSGTETSATFTLKSGCTTSSVTITANSNRAVVESNYTNDRATTSYTN